MVSIITPTYNCAKYISETINSVLEQTYTDWEMIIYDDCSTDDTKDIVKYYTSVDSRIKYFCNEHNSGAAITRNNALRIARGKWIAFLDSDDLWVPQKLEHQIMFMTQHGYNFSYHEYEEIDEQSNSLGILVSGKKIVSSFDMKACCWPGCLSVMYNADVIGLIQIHDIKKNNDTALWLSIIKKTKCYLLKENLGKYRRRCGSITPISIKQKIIWHYRLFKDAEKMKTISSLFWTFINIIGNSYKKFFFVKHIR